MGTYEELAALYGESKNTIDHTLRYIRANGFPDFARKDMTVRELGYLSVFFTAKKVRKKNNEAAMDALIQSVEADTTSNIRYQIKQRVVPVIAK